MVESGGRDGGAQAVFEALGFVWDREALPPAPEPQPLAYVVLRYKRALAGVVWDAAQLEGNPFSFPEVQTLLDGITVGGHKVSDQAQVQGLIDSSRLLVELVREGTFRLDKATSDRLHRLLGRDEALDAGRFRGEGEVVTDISVALGERGVFRPPPTRPGGANLVALQERALGALARIDSPWERALAYNAFGCRAQLYYDANKRISRHMMNGELMSHGLDALSVPAARRREYNALMVDFYADGDATALFAFLAECRLP